jgi:hypothetical protein
MLLLIGVDYLTDDMSYSALQVAAGYGARRPKKKFSFGEDSKVGTRSKAVLVVYGEAHPATEQGGCLPISAN